MNDLHSSKKQLALHSLTNWKAVLDLLFTLTVEKNEHIIISRKSETEWTVQTNLDTTKRQPPIKLTIKNRGIGLFDLNW